MGIARMALLRSSRSPWLAERMTRNPLARRAVRRFMPGETLEAAIEAAKDLETRGLTSILTNLGENVESAAAADEVVAHYLTALTGLRDLNSDISVKLTHLGLDLGTEETLERCVRLASRAALLGKRIALDMEGAEYVDRTLEVYRRLRADHENVAICLQAYLYRTAKDLDELIPLAPAIRLVKGAYREPADIAMPRKSEVDASFVTLTEKILGAMGRGLQLQAYFGTHDPSMIEHIQGAAMGAGLPKEAFEFQMLYGIQRNLQMQLSEEGYRVRVLVSYGSHWFPWFMRRLAERPANTLFVVKNVLTGWSGR